MRECPGEDGVWMCGLDPTDCTNTFSLPFGYINDNRNTTLGAILALPSAYTSSTSETGSATVTKTVLATVTASTITNTVLATVTASTSAISSPNSEKDNATTIGLGTGIGIGLPLLVALCVSLWLLYRAHKRIKVLGSHHITATSEIQN
jgi:hypothetical protein